MKIVLASDHGGYELKDTVKAALTAEGHEVVDLGTNSGESVDYPVYGRKCGEYVASGQAERGIVFCGSGIGICMAANKVHGVRCAMTPSDEHARLASVHNHANMLAFGGRFTGAEEALRHIRIWIETPWEGGRHDNRVALLDDI